MTALDKHKVPAGLRDGVKAAGRAVMQWNQQVALVTGAARGLGREFVRQLCAAGVRRVCAGVRGESGVWAQEAGGGTEVIALPLEVIDAAQVAEAARRCPDVTLLINNAGVNRTRGLLAASDLEAARQEMEINYFGALSVSRAFAPVLAANGGGTVVNMLSILARVNLPLMGSLCASKAAALSMTQGLRAELAAQGTRVVAVLPGAVDTDMSRDFPPPKADPAEVVAEVLRALSGTADEVYPDPMAQQLAAGLEADAKAVERELAAMLPN